ncbi:UNKNOWN [Stylonychia lemnae]|uniref:Uncharacterized protein n=1 Tax=Stylonychia lemnae TaxID=5949 RepID=A0A078ALG2_STYLE|nr:UNKNOWN [Stylonychia lemnae]|eukprot:CDW81698.1 UNKNOWN [Stylonychia lemnae]
MTQSKVPRILAFVVLAVLSNVEINVFGEIGDNSMREYLSREEAQSICVIMFFAFGIYNIASIVVKRISKKITKKKLKSKQSKNEDIEQEVEDNKEQMFLNTSVRTTDYKEKMYQLGLNDKSEQLYNLAEPLLTPTKQEMIKIQMRVYRKRKQPKTSSQMLKYIFKLITHHLCLSQMMLTIIVLSSIYGSGPIVKGAFGGYMLIILMGVMAGRFLIDSMSQSRVKAISGLLFLSIGLFEFCVNFLDY